MIAAPVESPDMPRHTEERKESLTVTLSPTVIARLKAEREKTEFKPSLSQLLEQAAIEWLERRDAAPRPPRSRKP